MLEAEDFFAGSLANAQPLTLVLPKRTGKEHFLIGKVGEEITAAFLDGSHPFHTMLCEGTTAWTGLLVPNVTIQVDPQSAFDPAMYDAPLGCMIRYEDKLALHAKAEGSGFSGRTVLLDLYSGLSKGDGDQRIAFRRWQVTIGAPDNCRILFNMDLPDRTAR